MSARTAVSPATDADEAALLARLRAGHEDAFESMVRTYGRGLLASARHMLRNEEDARDAVQETFIAAFRSLEGFREDARLSTWLRKIAVNQCLMKLRARKRRPEEPIEDLLPTFVEDGHQTRPSARFLPAAETAVAQRELRELVRGEIDQLPEAYRTVLLLRDIEELDTDTVADALGVNANTVKVRLHRARQALRTRLEPHFRREVESRKGTKRRQGAETQMRTGKGTRSQPERSPLAPGVRAETTDF